MAVTPYQEKTNRELYSNPSDPISSINPEAIKQSSFGNCFFLAGLTSLAKYNPTAISQMIRRSDSGKFDVSFPGASNEEASVGTPTDAELLLSVQSLESGIWPAVMAKAYASLENKQLDVKSQIISEAIAEGGFPVDALEALTGQRYKEIPTTDTRAIETALSRLDKLRAPAAASVFAVELTQAPIDEEVGLTANLLLTPGHAYAIVNYDQTKEIVSMRDPLAGDNGPRIEATLEEFLEDVDSLAAPRTATFPER